MTSTERPTLHLLGGAGISGIPAVEADRVLAQTKVIGCLAFLSLAPTGRSQRRDKVVGLLWPDLSQEHARAALRKVVKAARDTFGEEAIVNRGDEDILLDRTKLGCDATTFIERADANDVVGALDIYAGEFLPGFLIPGCSEFGFWLDDQRADISQRASAAAWTLATNLEARNQLTEAGKKAREAIRYDWRDERVLRRAMKMLYRIGDKAGAVSIYEETARRMLKELETELSDESKQLNDAIRKGQPIQ